MKYFVIFLTVIAIFIIATNPAYAICAYDPSQPHKPCDDSPGILIIETHQAKIEYVDEKPFYVIGPFVKEPESSNTIRLDNVVFTPPFYPSPPPPGGLVSIKITFTDGMTETISKVGPPEPFAEFTKHQNPQAGVMRNSDGTFNFLVSANLKKIPPLKQFKAGLSAEKIVCRDGLELVAKYDGSPACVKPETKQKLIEMGWTELTKTKIVNSSLPPCTSDRTACFNQDPNICDPSGWKCENGEVFSKVIPLPEPNQYPTVTFPQNATGSSPDSGPIPHVTVVLRGINDTISWINESDRTIIIRAYDNSWNAGEISPYNQIDVKFNHTGQYQYLIDILEDKRRAQGEIIVLGDDIDSLPIEERLRMAQAILGQHFRTLPIVSIGAGNADKVLDVTIHEDELEKFTDAHAYYETKVQEIIPFDVPIRIDFGPYPMLN